LGLLDAIPSLNEAMLVVHRQHLHVAGRRYSLWGIRPSEASTTECVVGFADMVGFTSLGERLDAAQLDVLLRNFEQRVARLSSSRRTRLVKLIGDEALFVAGSPEEAVSIASSLLRDPEIPDLRVGLAAGEIVTRGGDVYGSVVNLASRLVAIAAPRQILADARTVERLAPDGDTRVAPLGPHALPGFATPVEVFAVTPRSPTS
jgi:adenylate cyclase